MIPAYIARKYRFSSLGLIRKGYVSKQGFLIETIKLKETRKLLIIIVHGGIE